MKRKEVIAVGIGISLLVSFGALYTVRVSSKSSEGIKEEKKIYVKTEKVTKGEISKYNKYSSKVSGEKEEVLEIKMPSPITKINVKNGEYVEKGQVIMELDSKSIDEQIAKSKESYEKVLKSLEESQNKIKEMEDKIKGFDEEILKENERLEVIKSEGEALKEELRILEDKKKNGEITEEEYKKQKPLLEGKIAKNTMELAECTGKITSIELNKKVIEKLLESMKNTGGAGNMDLDSMLGQIDGMKESYIIRAPISGYMEGLSFRVGEVPISLMGGSPRVITKDKLSLTIGVSEGEKKGFSKGNEALVLLEGNKTLKGIVTEISKETDKKTNKYGVKIVFDNPKEIKIGSYGSVLIPKETKSDVIKISKNSVIREGNEVFVYVVKDGIPQKRKVSLGIENDMDIEVLEGLNIDEDVVVKGKEWVEEGEEINVVGGDNSEDNGN